MVDAINVIVAGVGGQGNVLASQMIALAAVEAGYHVTVGETFGASQRGGSVMSHVRLFPQDSLGPLIPRGKADVVLGFEPMETLRILSIYGNPNTKVVLNTRPTYPIKVLAGEQVYPELPRIIEGIKEHVKETFVLNATNIALSVGKPVVANLVMVGALCGAKFLPLDRKCFYSAIHSYFDQKLIDINEKAFNLGIEELTKNTTSWAGSTL
ncbi:MAG: indolepyruvate oxidoreductase subunit beta [Bacillota bacterium]|nr:indolepyruvate oxidoreductase subunit beta [Bacillota bacterium]